MGLTCQQLLDQFKTVNIKGMTGCEIDNETKSDGKPIIVAKFLTLHSAFNKNEDNLKHMIIDPEGGELLFYVQNLDNCEPDNSRLVGYMHANSFTRYGGHYWEPNREGRVSYRYSLPLPENDSKYPGTKNLQEIVSSIYRAITFLELNSYLSNIQQDPTSNDEEKDQKCRYIAKYWDELTGTEEDDKKQKPNSKKTSKKETI